MIGREGGREGGWGRNGDGVRERRRAERAEKAEREKRERNCESERARS